MVQFVEYTTEWVNMDEQKEKMDPLFQRVADENIFSQLPFYVFFCHFMSMEELGDDGVTGNFEKIGR